MRSGLGVNGERLWVRVIDCITGLMVARILLDASSGVQTSHGLADVHERLVVTATSEASSSDVDALLREVLYEKLLDRSGAGGTGKVEAATIAIKNSEVTTRDHVEVQVCENLVPLRVVQILGVVFRSQKTVL